MMSHEVIAAAATARHDALLAVADDRRRHRELRAAQRREGSADVVLQDGSEVLIRPLRPDDATLLVDGFARLSERSRRLRFLGPKKALTPAELHYFTEVDHRDHEALGALSRDDGRGIGVARYVRSVDDPASADCAVAVDNTPMLDLLLHLPVEVELARRDAVTVGFAVGLAGSPADPRTPSQTRTLAS